MQIFYTLKNNRVVSESSVRNAFMIYTGKNSREHGVDYLKWLHSLLGKSIVKVSLAKDLNPFVLYFCGDKTIALMVYSEKYGTSLAEAKRNLDISFSE